MSTDYQSVALTPYLFVYIDIYLRTGDVTEIGTGFSVVEERVFLADVRGKYTQPIHGSCEAM